MTLQVNIAENYIILCKTEYYVFIHQIIYESIFLIKEKLFLLRREENYIPINLCRGIYFCQLQTNIEWGQQGKKRRRQEKKLRRGARLIRDRNVLLGCKFFPN